MQVKDGRCSKHDWAAKHECWVRTPSRHELKCLPEKEKRGRRRGGGVRRRGRQKVSEATADLAPSCQTELLWCDPTACTHTSEAVHPVDCSSHARHGCILCMPGDSLHTLFPNACTALQCLVTTLTPCSVATHDGKPMMAFHPCCIATHQAS